MRESVCQPRRRFHAPGKVVLVGEYAVLDGAPAIVAAVDRGVEVEVFPAPVRTVQAPGDGRYAEAALSAAGAPAGNYAFRDWNPAPTATKAGFGGSAAACVAATLASAALRGETLDAEALVDRAEPIHRAIQGGGSGIDVAASAYGGVLRYQRLGDSAAGPIFRARPAPAVVPVVVWSGQSAATGPRVAKYLAWRGRNAFVAESSAIVERFGEDPVAALYEAYRALLDASTAAGIDWETPAHVRLAALALSFGGASKPSGAGGGDVAVALFPDPDAEAAFRAACARESFVVIPVNIVGGARAVAVQEP